MGGKGQLGHRAVRDEPAGSVLAVSPPAHRQKSAGSSLIARASYDGGRLSNAERGQITVEMREISR
jgi:hypothetical protein